jgi:Flp pilus assembly protein TadD
VSDHDDWMPEDPEALYRQLMGQDPESTLPRFSLGKLCLEKGRFPEAVDQLKFCVAKQGDWASAWLLLGDALSGAGEREPARDAYERCRQLSIAQHHSSLAEEAEEKSAALQR